MDAESKRKLLGKTIASLEQSVVVVEGKRDQLALQKAGIQCLSVAVAGRKLEETIKKIGALALGKRVVLLTDFDEEGKRKEKELREALLHQGVKADIATRRNFRHLFRLSTVEQLPFALERLEKEVAGNSN